MFGISGGRFGEGELDVPDVKTPSIISLTTKHDKKIGADCQFHCLFMSSARLNITDRKFIEMEYL